MTVIRQEDGSYRCNVHNVSPEGDFFVRVEGDRIRLYDQDQVFEGEIPLPIVATPPETLPMPAAESTPQPLSQTYRLATQGADSELDALAIMCHELDGLPGVGAERNAKRQRILSYLWQRFVDDGAPP